MKYLSCICLLLLSLISCVSPLSLQAEITTLRYEAETTVLSNGDFAYLIDCYRGENIADDYFIWRNEGNPTPSLWENAIEYQNGTDISLVPTSTVYSLSAHTEEWGVYIADVSQTCEVKAWSHLLNLEKYEDKKWVRQGVLNDARLSEPQTYTHILFKKHGNSYPFSDSGMPQSSQIWRDGLSLLSPLTVKVEEIFPVPTPGIYRFIFYFSVNRNGVTEYRKYYIPFEVVE